MFVALPGWDPGGAGDPVDMTAMGGHGWGQRSVGETTTAQLGQQGLAPRVQDMPALNIIV